ncbi:MAG TPA: Fe-Mn family superoxide dismutase [Polyangia bacterium]|nr:Fe-Mn family superoxide dismutase [Polyangia bacterium]
MAHKPRNFDRLKSELRGALSEAQLEAHFTLYQGYVKALATLEERLAHVDRNAPSYSFSEYSELRRREPVAYNGTILHELYFDNLGPSGQVPPDPLRYALASTFGSWEQYVADCKAIVGSGHGWCLTTYDCNFDVFRNNFVESEHHVGLFPNQIVMVAIDAWEHAYFLDYGIRKADYFQAIWKHIRWQAIETRLRPLTRIRGA